MINKMGKNFNDDIKNIEDEIENITNIQNEHINYLYILDNIISKIGNEISISQHVLHIKGRVKKCIQRKNKRRGREKTNRLNHEAQMFRCN